MDSKESKQYCRISQIKMKMKEEKTNEEKQNEHKFNGNSETVSYTCILSIAHISFV